MLDIIVGIILLLIALYLFAGLLIAIWMHTGPLKRVDENVENTGVFFRLMITPGMCALWPILLKRLKVAKAGQTPIPETEAHTTASRLRAQHSLRIKVITILIPILVALAIMGRPKFPVVGEIPPQLSQVPEPLPVVAYEDKNAFPPYSIQARLLSDESGEHYQLELNVTERPDIALPVVYWNDKPFIDETASSEFVGILSDTGIYRYTIPEEAAQNGSKFLLLSAYRGDDIKSTFKVRM